MSNEAAERLLIGPYATWDRESWEGTEGVEAALCTAVAYMKISLGFVLAAERKATVERIYAALVNVTRIGDPYSDDPAGFDTGEVLAILDAEADR